MEKKYYEVVFEGKYDAIFGMLEGFLLGEGAKWEWYSCKESGIESEPITKILKSLFFLKPKHQHFILEEAFHTALKNMLKKSGDKRYIKLKYTKSARLIKNCSFTFTADTYARKFGEEIKSIISAPPKGV